MSLWYSSLLLYLFTYLFPCDTLATRCDVRATYIWQHYGLIATALRHHCNILATSFRRPCGTMAASVRHHHDLHVLSLWHPCDAIMQLGLHATMDASPIARFAKKRGTSIRQGMQSGLAGNRHECMTAFEIP